ncbi:MAG: transposase [Candidatus Magasanikbacteria bacterium]|nr:transposase [Candidatus Magasanikbacteria bacterium]
MPVRPARKLNRWHKWDYSNFGFYFVTICTQGRQQYFGEIRNGLKILNKCGKIVENFLGEIEGHFKNVYLDEFVVMPNHVHAIILVDNQVNGKRTQTIVGNVFAQTRVGTGQCPVPTRRNSARYGLLSKIINGLKNVVTKEIRKQFRYNEFGWQRSFHDHIIRTPTELNRVRQYIAANPENWEEDRNNPKNFKKL